MNLLPFCSLAILANLALRAFQVALFLMALPCSKPDSGRLRVSHWIMLRMNYLVREN